jgi:hypothetical protein
VNYGASYTFNFLKFWFCWSIGATTQLINELDNYFLKCALFDAMGIIYPHYWLQPGWEAIFVKHLEVMKVWYYEPKIMGNGESRFIH